MADRAEIDMLMTRLAEGDRGAFSPLFRAVWPSALKVCEGLLPSADAADAAQSAMVKILERANEYDKNRPALPWALGIAAWECRTFRKKQKRRHEVHDEVARSDEGATVRDLEQKELVGAAMHAMGALSAADQETLTATYWGADTDVTGATFRKRRERAIHRLRDSFRRLYGLD